jgi:hypothetical protein
MTQGLGIKVKHHFNAMGFTAVEALYDFIKFTEQGSYLYENAYLREATATKVDDGIRQCLVMTWVFHREEAETFYVLKWTD